MSSSDNDPQTLTAYAVRIEIRPDRDIQEALLRIAELSGDEIARSWLSGLYQALATLGTLPRRCPVASEARFFRAEVRQLLYKRTQNGPTYRILFTIVEEGGDGPMVSILHIRHAARKPMTRNEAREIQLL